MMKPALRFLVLLVGWMGISFSVTTASADTSTLKCNSNKDRVWVYDSLTGFDIQAKLNCAETVEIIERVKGFVRIRARNGVEGYVPETAISGLPAFNDQTPDVGTVAKQVQAREIAKAAESKSSFITTDADSQSLSSLDPSTVPAEKVASHNNPTAVSQVMQFTTLAEMGPRPSSVPVKKASPNAVATAAITPPIASYSKPLDGPSAETPSVAGSTAISTGGSEGSADLRLGTESADSACQRYFSAYGLTSSQLKWIAQNRKKMFPSVCPAPDTSKVDFVIIFTHDVNFFSATMPETVHILSGFSDFQPLTTVDSALVPASEANKAHREYVWIFQFAKGGFNPETFSPHRRYQFTKVETNSLGSSAGPRAVEDAFHFVETTNR